MAEREDLDPLDRMQREWSEEEAQRYAITLLKSIETHVRVLSDLYEAFPFLNSKQPLAFSGPNGLFPMSLDEWAIGLSMAIKEWEKRLDRKGGDIADENQTRTSRG